MVRIGRYFKAGFAITLLFGAAAAWAQQRKQVDDAALKTGSKTGDEVIAYGGNWAEQRYSPLDQINASNVSQLKPAWTTEIPVAPGTPAQTHQENTPLVFNGVLYGITPWSIVYAVDLHTHKEIWRADPEVDQAIWQSRICCGVVNRGIALYQGKDHRAGRRRPTAGTRLRRPARFSGKSAFRRTTWPTPSPWRRASSRAVRSSLVSAAASTPSAASSPPTTSMTGKLAWRFYTVPGDPSKPFEHPELGSCRQNLEQRVVEDRRRRRRMERHGV